MLEFIRKNNIDIPVIFLTGHTNPADEAKGLALGAADYIHKPIERNILLLRLERLLNN